MHFPQLVSTPIEALRMEANVPSYTTTSNRKVLKAKDKSLQSSADHPQRIAFNVKVPQRLLTRSRWRRKANKLSEALPDALNHRQKTELFNIHPWHLNSPNSCNICCFALGIKNRADNISLKTRMSIERIDNHHADYIICTDGRATLGSKDDSFVVLITKGPANNPTTIDTIKERGQSSHVHLEKN